MQPDTGQRLSNAKTGVAGTRLLHARHISFPAPMQIVHAEYSVKLTTKGKGAAMRYRGEYHAPCGTGMLTLFEPFEPVLSATSMTLTSFDALLIDPSVMKNATESLEPDATARFDKPHVRDPGLERLMGMLVEDATRAEDETQVEECVVSIISQVLRQGRPSSTAELPLPVLSRLRDLIIDRMAENVSLDELEAESGMSRYHLLRCFRERYGLPPHAFRTHARIARARSLIVAGLALPDVAQRVGFCDQSQLHRHFRRITGATPGNFRRAIR